ncbi:Ribosomal protein S19, mitochondrial [Linum perenne]
MLASIRRKVLIPSITASINHGVTDLYARAGGNPANTWPLSAMVSAHCKDSSGYGLRRLFSSAAEGSETKAPIARAMWKGPFVDAFLLKLKNKGEGLANRKIWSRRSVILPEFLNSTVRIYNGKTFIRCKITEGKVGHKFGEFALTRRRKKMRGTDTKGAKKGGKK